MPGCGSRLRLRHGPQLCSSASGPDVGQCFGEECDKQGGTEMIRDGKSPSIYVLYIKDCGSSVVKMLNN